MFYKRELVNAQYVNSLLYLIEEMCTGWIQTSV